MTEIDAERTRNAGYDDWLDGVESGEGTYLSCPNGHGSLPPRRVCPHCGSPELSEEPLPEEGEIETFTVVHVAGPTFADETPYVTAVAAFGPAELTGVVRGVDPEDVDVGTTVEADVGVNETNGERLLIFRPR